MLSQALLVPDPLQYNPEIVVQSFQSLENIASLAWLSPFRTPKKSHQKKTGWKFVPTPLITSYNAYDT